MASDLILAIASPLLTSVVQKSHPDILPNNVRPIEAHSIARLV